MGRHTAPAGRRPAPQETEAPPRSVHSHRAHRAASRRRSTAVPAAPASSEPPTAPAPSAFVDIDVVESRRAPRPDAAREFASRDAATEPAPRPVARHRSGPGPRALARGKFAPSTPRSHRRRATRERAESQPTATAPLEPAREEPRSADGVSRPRLVTRVTALPRVLLDTVAWGGFAAVVALIVIALSDVGVGTAALWAVGLSGIVVLAVAVMAVTGAHLDNLSSPDAGAVGPD